MNSVTQQDHFPGRLVVISGPSGVGKSTIVSRLLSQCPLPLVLSVSATTRPCREGEKEGVNYHFLSNEEFQRRKAAGEFLECFEVFGRGYWYGTLRSEVASGLEAGKWIILEIDVQGAMEVLDKHPSAISIFLRTDTLETLEQRLRGRRTESEESIQKRLNVARHELSYADRYDLQVVNHAVDDAVREICEFLLRHK